MEIGSFAYRVTQFILNNKHIIYCKCKNPVPRKSSNYHSENAKIFCDNCKGLIESEHPIGN